MGEVEGIANLGICDIQRSDASQQQYSRAQWVINSGVALPMSSSCKFSNLIFSTWWNFVYGLQGVLVALKLFGVSQVIWIVSHIHIYPLVPPPSSLLPHIIPWSVWTWGINLLITLYWFDLAWFIGVCLLQGLSICVPCFLLNTMPCQHMHSFRGSGFCGPSARPLAQTQD